MSSPGLAVAVRPVLQRLQLAAGAVRRRADAVDRRRQLGAFLRHPGQRLDRRAVLHDHVSGGAEIGARTSSTRRAAIDGANWWQRIWYVTLPMMRNIIAITDAVLADRHLRQFRHRAHPHRRRPDRPYPRLFATWAFWVGIQGSDIPLGASVSLFMVPILAVAAIFILRDINQARE